MAKIKTNTQVGIMVCLDAILDTRLGTIAKLFPDVFGAIENSPKYYLRKEDRWDSIDNRLNNSQIVLNYQARNVDTIRKSQLTMVSRMILELFNELGVKIRSSDPSISSFYLVINFHPYVLSEDIKIGIAKHLTIQLGCTGIPVGAVDRPWKELNPTFLKENNIKYWYCYHYEEWLRENFEPVGTEKVEQDIDAKGCPEVKMFVPKIAQDQKAVDDFLASITDCPYTDQFDLTRSVTSNLINFNFAPVSFFSRIDIDKFKKAEEGEEMERSQILGTQEKAVNEIMKRLGESPLVSKNQADHYIDELERLVFELRAFNTKKAFSLFKHRLAELNLTVSKLYNSVPFDSGSDLENLLDQLSLAVDTSEEEYDITEKYWNSQGVETIKTTENAGTGETIYRCIAANDYLELGLKSGQILKPNRSLNTPPRTIDSINFLNYFEM